MTTAGSARRKKRADLAFVATCGSGLEQLVATEIVAAGGKNPVITPGAVAWDGNLETGYRLCLWSRFASRVLLQIGQFEAPDQETLYQQAGKRPFADKEYEVVASEKRRLTSVPISIFT